MEPVEGFLSEWQRLADERQRLVGEAERLRKKLSSLPQDSEVKKLLEEKQKLKTEASQLGSEIHAIKEDRETSDARHLRSLKRRKLALTDQEVRHGIDDLLDRRRKRLATLRGFLKDHHPVIVSEERMVFELEAPIEEVEELYRSMSDESQREQGERQCALDAVNESIKGLEEHYRQVKHCLEDAIRDAERKMQEHHAEQVEWATQSRSHLEWTLKYVPSYKDEAVRRYKVRFPEDDLADLLPPAPVQNHDRGGNSKRRRNRSRIVSAPAEEVVITPLPAWRFWVTFNAQEPGQELSSQKEQFLACLQTVLEKEAYLDLSAIKVYHQLMVVTKMKTAQRQQIKKVMVDRELLGWKIVRAGREHRLFLLVDEENRHVRFLPRRRKMSYSEH